MSVSPTARCVICEEWMPAVDLLTHLRLLHPDHWQPLAEWPDGAAVIEDDTLTANDFHEGGAS